MITDVSSVTPEHWIALITQTVMVTAVGVTMVAILLRQKNNMLYRLMLVISIGTLLQNVGYLQELRSYSVNEVLAGLRIEYVGGSFSATLFLALVLMYCGYKIPRKLFVALATLDILVVLSVWTCEFNPLYYTSVEFEANAAIPHVILGKGVLYILFAVITFGELVATLVITLYNLIRAKNREKRRNYQLLLMSSVFPMITYFIGLLKVFPCFDAIPLGIGLGMISLAIAVLFHHAFDLVATAHENIIKELDEAVLIVDENYNFVEANGQALSLFSAFIDYMKSSRSEDGKLAFLFQQEQDAEMAVEDRIYRMHQNEIEIDNRLSGYVLILFDITEERRQLENMQRLKDEADIANAAKTNFLAHVSHEIRTPINAVLGMDEMILRQSADPETQKYAGDIKNAARTLLSIINDILDFSKLESGKMELVPAEYEMNTLLSDVYNMMVVKANDKQLQFKFEIDPTLPSVLRGDDIRIRQILLNLLSNAVKYTNEGAVTLRVSCLSQEPDMTSATVKYEVIDTGIGIKAENIPHLYEAFERIDLQRNRGVEGTGLGMSIVVQFLKLMGSALKVESVYGEGSNFSFELTQQVLDASPINDFKQSQQEAEDMDDYAVSFVAPKAKVLVVDDNATNRVVFRGLLQMTQVQISEADSGMACLEMVQKEHFDVIFMDDMMPGMTGRETLQAMQGMEKHLCMDTPVVMLTANAIHGEKEKYLKLGFHDFLVKPIDPEQLEAMLGRLLPAPMVCWR